MLMYKMVDFEKHWEKNIRVSDFIREKAHKFFSNDWWLPLLVELKGSRPPPPGTPCPRPSARPSRARGQPPSNHSAHSTKIVYNLDSTSSESR